MTLQPVLDILPGVEDTGADFQEGWPVANAAVFFQGADGDADQIGGFTTAQIGRWIRAGAVRARGSVCVAGAGGCSGFGPGFVVMETSLVDAVCFGGEAVSLRGG